MARELGFSTRKRASKLCLALVSTSPSSAFFCPRCGVRISTLRWRFSLSSSSSASRSSNSTGHVDLGGDELLVQVDLLEQRAEERRLVVLHLVFPEELAAIHNLPVAQVEEIERHQRRLGVDREDIDVVALGRGHLLALLDLFHGGDQVAQSGGFLEAHLLAGGFHADAHIRAPDRVWRPSRNRRTSRTAAAYASSVVSPWTHGPRQR